MSVAQGVAAIVTWQCVIVSLVMAGAQIGQSDRQSGCVFPSQRHQQPMMWLLKAQQRLFQPSRHLRLLRR
jgi:hypothetical protein